MALLADPREAEPTPAPCAHWHLQSLSNRACGVDVGVDVGALRRMRAGGIKPPPGSHMESGDVDQSDPIPLRLSFLCCLFLTSARARCPDGKACVGNHMHVNPGESCGLGSRRLERSC